MGYFKDQEEQIRNWIFLSNFKSLEERQELEQRKDIEIGKVPSAEMLSLFNDQGVGVSVVVRWLGILILGAIEGAVNITDDVGRNKYLDKFCGTYLNVFISKMVYLASPACGNTPWAIQCGIEALDAKELAPYMSGDWSPSENPNEKRGNEPA